VWTTYQSSLLAFGTAGSSIVLVRFGDALVRQNEPTLSHLAAVALGAVGGLAAQRIIRAVGRTVQRVAVVRADRTRPRDDLITDLVYVAYLGAAVLSGRGPDSWRHRRTVRRYAQALDQAATNIERAPSLARAVPLRDARTRRRLREPYGAVAAIVREHRTKAFSADDAAQWRAIAESLAAGALAAARRDWPALTRNAPLPGPGRRARLARTARHLSTSVVLLASAIVLPEVLNLGAYAASLRAILAVSAVIALLPNEAGGIVRDTLSKALPGK
jgi:hypothetical protein